jgi:hypothetical protein
VPGQSDPGLHGLHPAGTVFLLSLPERRAVLGQAPGDGHQGVAVLGQARSADAAAAGDGGGLAAGRGQAGGRVQVPGGREPGDRQLKTAKAAARIAFTPGRLVRTWPSVAARRTSVSAAVMSPVRSRQRRMPRASRLVRAAASPGGGRQSRHRPAQKPASARVSLPSARACSDRAGAGRPCRSTRQGQIRQRGTVPVVGLEPARAQLSPGRRSLRRREHPDRCREPAVQLADPGPVQAAGRLDREHQLPARAVLSDAAPPRSAARSPDQPHPYSARPGDAPFPDRSPPPEQPAATRCATTNP